MKTAGEGSEDKSHAIDGRTDIGNTDVYEGTFVPGNNDFFRS